MRLVGEEGELGLIQGVAGMLTAILVYVLGEGFKTETPDGPYLVSGC